MVMKINKRGKKSRKREREKEKKRERERERKDKHKRRKCQEKKVTEVGGWRSSGEVNARQI